MKFSFKRFNIPYLYTIPYRTSLFLTCLCNCVLANAINTTKPRDLVWRLLASQKEQKYIAFFLPEQQIISVWHQTLLQTRIPITANRRYTTLSITYSSTSPLYTDYLTLKIAKYAIWCPNFFHCTQSHRCFFCVCVPHPSFCISFTKKKRVKDTTNSYGYGFGVCACVWLVERAWGMDQLDKGGCCYCCCLFGKISMYKTKRKVGSMRIPKGRLPPWEGPNTSESALVALLGGRGGGETRASQFTFMVTRTDNGNVQIQRSWSFTLRFRESYSQSDRINK